MAVRCRWSMILYFFIIFLLDQTAHHSPKRPTMRLGIRAFSAQYLMLDK